MRVFEWYLAEIRFSKSAKSWIWLVRNENGEASKTRTAQSQEC